MSSLNIATRVYMCGALAALVVLPSPAAAAVPDSPTVRVTRPAGRVVLDVADEHVTVRKEVSAERSVVTLATATDRLSITIRRGMLSVTHGAETFAVEPRSGVDGGRLAALLQRSDAAAKGRRLLATIQEGPETFAGQSLLLTRAILELGTGDAAALNQHQQWVGERAAQSARTAAWQGSPRVLRAAYLVGQQRGPGDCWDLYHKEAIKIADDFGDCTDGLAWYEAHKWAGCSLIYAVRSEGAMAWFIACNGGVPFSG